MIACNFGSCDIVRELLLREASLKVFDNFHFDALLYAWKG
jgi:hypothetical protein